MGSGIEGMLFLGIVLVFSEVQASKARAANCQLWRVPVEVDPPKHNNRPYYVEMHRCMGQCTNIDLISPLQCECVAATTQDITLNVVTPLGYESQIFKNHTSCRSQCKASYKEGCIKEGYNWDEPTCTCSCPQQLSGSCAANQLWNTRSCQCECTSAPSSCSSGMSWNKSSCSCQCSAMAFAKCSKNGWATSLKTCRCIRKPLPPPKAAQVGKRQSSESETKLVVPLVVISLLLGTLFVIDLVLMGSKKGFMYGLKTKCSKKGDREFINGTETGSVTLNMDHPVVAEQEPVNTTNTA
ncbi:Hypothetical predicted protein [Paramuricea clavata]|uniref:Uncharacterized protein n=1 Tax=Paramuricea clavata TaxID=317549 RepID=A0A7D9HQL6_PARCT|nr:Hypothetical predicted protein [Paramuricea clavata]